MDNCSEQEIECLRPEIEKVFFENLDNVVYASSKSWLLSILKEESDTHIYLPGTSRLKVSVSYDYEVRNRKSICYVVYFYFDCLTNEGVVTCNFAIGSLIRPALPAGLLSQLNRAVSYRQTLAYYFLNFDFSEAVDVSVIDDKLKFGIVNNGTKLREIEILL